MHAGCVLCVVFCVFLFLLHLVLVGLQLRFSTVATSTQPLTTFGVGGAPPSNLRMCARTSSGMTWPQKVLPTSILIAGAMPLCTVTTLASYGYLCKLSILLHACLVEEGA